MARPHASWPRIPARSLIALMLVLVLVGFAEIETPAPVAAQLPGGTNLTLTPSKTSPQVGEPVNFDYRASPPAVAPPFASITSLMLDFGDGTTADLSGSSAPGKTVEGTSIHTYSSPGSYTAVLSAAASNGGSGRTTASLTVVATGSVPGGPVIVSFPAGWNLMAIPPGAEGGSTHMPYTYGPNDTAYVGSQNPQSGVGYWVFFNQPGTLAIPSGSPQTATASLPPSHWVMVGNPGSRPATVRGADTVYVYNQASGYQQTTTLQPGQGAWVISTNGGTVTISS